MHNYDRIAKALKYIRENFSDQPNLDEVARQVHLSPYHFNRLFKEWAGVTPKKFLQYISVEYAKELLSREMTVEETTYKTGLSSTSRLHDLFVNIEGMTPGEYKNGGENLIIYFHVYDSPFGLVSIASTDIGICSISFVNNDEEAFEELEKSWPNARLEKKDEAMHNSVIRLFQKDWQDLPSIKLHVKGAEFQLKVWETLLRIPAGCVRSYSDIAEQAGRPNAQRAVGNAVAKNPIAYIIPCHRVIKKLGRIGEYKWGTIRKAAILGWEFGNIRQD